MSSSSAKPCTHHTVAVLASALATKGRAIAPTAASPADARKIDRLVGLSISSLPCSKRRAAACASIRGSGEYAPSGGAVQLLTTAPAPRAGSNVIWATAARHSRPDRSSLAELPRFRGGRQPRTGERHWPLPLRAPL